MERSILLIPFLFLFVVKSIGQNSSDESEIERTIEIFFQSLSQQDSSLYKSILLLDGQVWTVNNTETKRTHRVRSFRDDITMFNPDNRWRETALAYTISVHNGLATAWVPYEFFVDDKFSHCGVDIFNLIKTQHGWKIASVLYTVEKQGCEGLQKSIRK